MARSQLRELLYPLTLLDREMVRVLGHAYVVTETHDPSALVALQAAVCRAATATRELRLCVIGGLVEMGPTGIPELPSLAESVGIVRARNEARAAFGGRTAIRNRRRFRQWGRYLRAYRLRTQRRARLR